MCTSITETPNELQSKHKIIGASIGVATLLILLIAILFGTKRYWAREDGGRMDIDENPVYATYEVRDDSVAEVRDSNTYYSRGDNYGENSIRTQVRDNNSQYMFS